MRARNHVVATLTPTPRVCRASAPEPSGHTTPGYSTGAPHHPFRALGVSADHQTTGEAGPDPVPHVQHDGDTASQNRNGSPPIDQSAKHAGHRLQQVSGGQSAGRGTTDRRKQVLDIERESTEYRPLTTIIEGPSTTTRVCTSKKRPKDGAASPRRRSCGTSAPRKR